VRLAVQIKAKRKQLSARRNRSVVLCQTLRPGSLCEYVRPAQPPMPVILAQRLEVEGF
jgi:hypothetical protein